MDRQIVFLMSGMAHLPYLTCALWTLKDHWQGETVVHAWPESHDVAGRIAEDGRLCVAEVCKREPAYRRRDGVGGNSQFLDKIKVAQESDAAVVLYLDADVTVHGSLDPVFAAAEQYGFAATQWNDWVTTGRRIGVRIENLRAFPEIDRTLIDDVLSRPWPSVNGGVWATNPGSPVLPLWHEWTLVAKSLFIADEKVLHVLQARFVPQGLMTTVCEDGKYNSSPMHQSRLLRDEDVVVYHFHGDCNVRPQKSQRGFDLWWPVYRRCLEENAGGMREWIGRIKNKHMSRLKKEKQDG